MKKKHVYIDPTCSESLIEFQNKEKNSGKAGNEWDLDLFHDDDWLMDSAVIDTINPSKGQWEIYLNFICTKKPFKIIRRKITNQPSLNKAKFAANTFRRQAARDPRGTIQIQESYFDFCDN